MLSKTHEMYSKTSFSKHTLYLSKQVFHKKKIKTHEIDSKISFLKQNIHISSFCSSSYCSEE